MPSTERLQGEVSVLQTLVTTMMSPASPVPWQQHLVAGQYPAISATYFLLDTSIEPSVEQFIVNDLGRLLQHLNRSTQQQRVEYEGQVRGRIAWPDTFKARYGQDYNPGRYVCREVRHQYNTPENQLLKYVVARIGECLRAIPQAIWDGFCCFSPAARLETTIATATRLGRIQSVLNSTRYSARLHEVTLPPTIREFHLQRAETVRSDDYATVAHIYRRYRAIVLAPTWPEIAGIGRHMLLLPGHLDEASRLWIQLGADILRDQNS